MPPVSWEKCIFCQKDTPEDELRNIQVMTTSKKILDLAQQDTELRLRLAGVNDLIAAEGKYHLICYREFLRKYQSTSSRAGDPYSICLHNVADELRAGLARGEIYSLKTVWERYCKFLGDFDLEPGIYKGQRFKTKLEKLLQGKALFVQSLKSTDSIIIFPEMTAGTALLNMKKLMDDKQDDAKGMTMASCGTDKDTEILSWLYRVLVKVKADIRESPRHDVIGGIDQHHAEKTVPDSLYILLRLLCINDDDSENENEQSHHTKLLSIAQDIVFLASGGRRPTPKHIGIGVALHQATRSKDFVQLLHAAGHSISYESVLRADITMANEAMKRYFENGEVYIPLKFVNASLPGYIMYANDNIDINEESLDRKGTFHASQTAAFRRSNPEEEIPKIMLKSGRSKSVSVPPGVFELSDADMESQKPLPKFSWFSYTRDVLFRHTTN
ncbi:uncharacterized protein LOC127504083 isoform X1 [Ctenopharyngodon idella]|uniref:uncharacterized protein LOC127504083 isoform X1 n=1 Tax=Ctenopharyngodon idella TaxID=7959 RepID=UPI00222FBDB8|nr:uncharacterized protein LOC127504083 isoform X1 [Ctenopharyngodon idella]XP_051734451.1 uncharacterized protein LOC127504083 isoform X1 [Ctenopharyngodon idella]XP_051734461.1 uncharacterized protein LOC127504083 isoform X1 [Ctenopharyngodon idella]